MQEKLPQTTQQKLAAELQKHEEKQESTERITPDTSRTTKITPTTAEGTT